LSLQELKELAAEIRLDLSSLMSLNPSMAVVELTVAMQYIMFFMLH
jgi:deoxyxylulose-5-phosphate synthase